MLRSSALRSPARRPAPARRLSTSLPTSPSIPWTRSSRAAAARARAPLHGRVVGPGALDRLGPGLLRVAVGRLAHVASVLQGLALDLGSRRLGRLDDALHLRAGG